MEYDLEPQFVEALTEMKSASLKTKIVAMKKLVEERLVLENEFKLQAVNLQTEYEIKYQPLYEKVIIKF